MNVRLKAAAICDCGRVRQKNEDNLFFNGLLLPENHKKSFFRKKAYSGSKCSVFGVFDGMGGFHAGEKASYAAAETAWELRRKNRTTTDPLQLLLDICNQANQAVCDLMQRNNNERMGTTAVMLTFANGRYYLCNVGDSPAFLLRRGELRQLSVEHTERTVFERVTGTKSDPKRKFRLTQHLGVFPDELKLEPYYDSGWISPGDTFLLCSDGLTDMLETAAIRRILQGSGTAGEAARQLLSEALSAGGKDNITAIVIKVEEASGIRNTVLNLRSSGGKRVRGK